MLRMGILGSRCFDAAALSMTTASPGPAERGQHPTWASDWQRGQDAQGCVTSVRTWWLFRYRVDAGAGYALPVDDSDFIL